MRTSKELLLRFRHDPTFRFEYVEVCYMNRGAPGNLTCIPGTMIRNLDSSWMEVVSESGETFIPYHRIRRVLYRGEVMWDRAVAVAANAEKRRGR